MQNEQTPRGSLAMSRAGRRPVQIWFTADELARVREVCGAAREPVATWARRVLLIAAAQWRRSEFGEDVGEKT